MSVLPMMIMTVALTMRAVICCPLKYHSHMAFIRNWHDPSPASRDCGAKESEMKLAMLPSVKTLQPMYHQRP
jgi:hypothetical protein